LGVLFTAILIGVAFAARRRRSSGDSGVGLAVWLMIPLVLVICALGVWTLMKTLDFMGPAF
jgi:hypothetical protein